MRLKYISFLFLIFCLHTSKSSAALRIGFLPGLAVSVSVEESSFVEAPLGSNFFFDYTINESWVLGLEHMRTWGVIPVSSSNSFTLMTLRFYVMSDVPLGGSSDLSSEGSYIINDDFGYYIAGSIGTGQASVNSDQATNNASVVGVSLGIKGGIDYNLYDNLGLRAEGGLISKVGGKGELAGLFALFGVYLNL